jgi:hypothetical protein
MGGDCSQKAHAPEGTAILSGALEPPASARKQNSIATLFCLPGGAVYRTGALGSIWERSGKAEAGSGGDQPAEE